ncbi:GIY-YIG nuclease family protein [Roseibium sp.]|uniref:GIY-YIG nuclease family protein n=1 Tax=Roseibium sp. TaxID=1936156 RepID=UPI003BAD0C9F
MPAHVYMLASGRNGTLYLGVTSNLSRRLFEHQNGLLDGFSKRYHVTRLVYAEEHERVDDAIAREKQLKGWRRAWKIALIEESNPEWSDLSEGGLF